MQPNTGNTTQRKTCFDNVKKIAQMNEIIHEANVSRDTQILEDMASMENSLAAKKPFKNIAI